MTPLLLLLSSLALAAPVGQPVALPKAGSLEVVLRGDVEVAPIIDAACPRDGQCDAVWRTSRTAAQGRLAVARGVGVFGEVGWSSQRVREADYRGNGLAGAAGVRAAVPVIGGGWWLAADGRFDWGSGQGKTLDLGSRESAAWRVGTASLLAAWRQEEGGVSTWVGGQAAWLWDLHVAPLGTENDVPRLDLGFTPTHPVAWVGGAELTSEPLGGGWRRSARVSVAFEGRIGQSLGASASLGVSY